MSEQLALLDVPATPQLTGRQAAALEHLRAAGPRGLHGDEVGAYLCERRGKHPAGERCLWCGREANDVLDALRRKGYARFRRPRNTSGYWVAVDAMPRGMSDHIPF